MNKRSILAVLVILLIPACNTQTPSPTQEQEAPSEVKTEIPPTAVSPWVTKKSMPSARSEMSAVEMNGLIYIAGGYGPVRGGSANGYDSVTTFEAYDPNADAWTAFAPTPAPRDHSMIAAFQGKIYVFGGYYLDWKVQNNTWVYDPATNGWTILTDMPAPRTSGAAVTIGNSIYLVGGITSQAGVILPTWRYDPLNDTWENVAPLLQPREHVNAVALDGLIYALAGRWVSSLNTVEIYDPAKDEWTQGVPMHDPRGGFGATVMNGKIYVAGGELIEVGKTVKSVEVFDPATQAWSSLPDLSNGLHGVPLIGYENILYLFGGSGRAADMINWGQVFAYQP